jgi:pheromone shutdown protein TraB
MLMTPSPSPPVKAIQYKNITVVPTYHSNLDFAHQVRQIFYQDPPDAIAVEFPEALDPLLRRGIERLPKISIIVYYDEMLKSQLFVPIEPSDSLIEAFRLGTEYGIPVHCIDLFVKNYAPTLNPQPDSYVLKELSLAQFYSLYRDTVALDKVAEAQFQAQSLQSFLKSKIQEQEGDLLESDPGHFPELDESIGLLSPEDEEFDLAELDLDESDFPEPSEMDEKSPASQKRRARRMMNAAAALELDRLRNQYLAAKLRELMTQYPKVLVVMGLAHWEPVRVLLEHGEISDEITALVPDSQPEIYNVEQEDLPKIMLETPNLVWQFEEFRAQQKDRMDALDHDLWRTSRLQQWDQFDGIKEIFYRALDRYQREYNERVSPQKLKAIFQYMRNLPLVEAMITPKLFEIVLAAKGIVNDDFAWIVWDECKKYPAAHTDPKMETLEFDEHGIYLHGKHFRLRRHIPVKLMKVKVPLKPKPEEKVKGEWKEQWNQNKWNLVSHIPEDFFEENYFQHVRRRSLSMMREHFIRIHKFTSTLLDGIDFRETIRNWPLEHQIYVKEERPIKGDVDAVVIIFDPDEKTPQRYPFKTVWYAEHKHESDLGLYSTPPGEILVGPGISRVELGGIVSF